MSHARQAHTRSSMATVQEERTGRSFRVLLRNVARSAAATLYYFSQSNLLRKAARAFCVRFPSSHRTNTDTATTLWLPPGTFEGVASTNECFFEARRPNCSPGHVSRGPHKHADRDRLERVYRGPQDRDQPTTKLSRDLRKTYAGWANETSAA